MTTTTDDGVARAQVLLRAAGIDAEVIEHPGVDGSRSEDAARALGVGVGDVIKCLILLSRKCEPVAAVVGGDRRLDVKALEAASGMKKLSMAPAAEIERLTGFKAGGVPPVAVLGKMAAFIDSALLDKLFIIGSGGSPRAGLKVSPAALVKAGMTAIPLS
jgi:Cys-tRNA(Pro)/Cys-tRNA(Cys) deacylase